MGSYGRFIGLGTLILGACTATHVDAPDLSPGVGNSVGQGNGALYVDAYVIAAPAAMNTTDAALFDVSFRVFVKAVVGGDWSGTVTITSNNAELPLAFDGTNWVGTISGYEQVYQLDIEGDRGYVRGVRVEGPDIHRITAPVAGATVHAANDTVAWERTTPAAEVTLTGVQLGEYLHIQDDLGVSYSNGLGNAADPNDTLTVTRTNRIEPAGTASDGLSPSRFSVNVSNSVEVVVAP